MKMQRCWQWLSLGLAIIFLGPVSPTWGQKPPPPIPPNPLAPTVAMPFPMGMQRGTTLEVVLTGTNLAGPTGLYTSFPAKVTIPTDNKNGLDNTKLRVRLEVPASAPIGYHQIRLATTRGISNLRLFCIDDLPQVLEVDTNRNKMTPQMVPVPCVVAGRIDAETADYYKISVKAGQRITIDVLGRRLGGLLDPELSVYDARDLRKDLAHQNDSPGCQTDARLTYTFKEAGDYVIEVRDMENKGGPDYCYRLRIGDFPSATVPLPMAAKRGSKVTLQFAGPMVEGIAPVEVAVPADPAIDTIWVAPKGANGLHGWPVALKLSDHDELVEMEPNNEPAKAQPVPVPGGVTGRFQQAGDLDIYKFKGKKGQKLLIQADTLELYSPTLVEMVVKNVKGAELARSNPLAAPPIDQRIEFTPSEDGDYLLEVQHLNSAGGPNEAYRVTITPSIPDFDLSLGLDRFDLAADSPLALTVLVARRGYTGPIEVNVMGHPGFSGGRTIPAGQNAASLLVVAKGDLPMGPYAIHILGKATINGKVETRIVQVRPAISQSMSLLRYPPRNFYQQIALAIREKAPFKLIAKWDQAEKFPGSKATLTILAERSSGFDEVITLDPPIGLPPTVPAPKLPAIAKGMKEIKVDIALNPKAPLGNYLILVSGKTKFQKKDFLARSMPAKLSLTFPFTLKVEPVDIKLPQGGKAKLKITAMRKAGYQGPIAVEIRKLPAGVTAPKGAIAMGQNSIELEMIAAPTAPAAAIKGVDVVGTATAANNLQSVSPPIAVTVVKK
jgi:hypothetical protein